MLIGDDIVQEALWKLTQSDTKVDVKGNIGSLLPYL